MRAHPLTSATVLATVAAVVAMLLSPAPGTAAARVSIANEFGTARIDPTYTTSLRISGRGFQSINKGFGGIYVLFGTVSGSWRPSAGGQGSTHYVPDSQAKNNAGYQRFVAFPGGETAGSANGGTISRNGTWSATINVPGAKFNTVDSDNKPLTVDCRKVTCGVITIGAHGVANKTNETFTPVRVADLYKASAPATSSSGSTSSGSATGGAATSGTAGSAVAPGVSATGEGASAQAGKARKGKAAGALTAVPVLAIDRASAAAGKVLSFTGTGLPPGRQVTAVFDNGAAGSGPFMVGTSGQMAGVVQLPRDLGTGTHELRLVGADGSPTVRFAVAAPSSAQLASAETSQWQPVAFVATGTLAVLVSLLLLVRRMRRRTRA